jgi:hypothetical protein
MHPFAMPNMNRTAIAARRRRRPSTGLWDLRVL